MVRIVNFSLHVLDLIYFVYIWLSDLPVLQELVRRLETNKNEHRLYQEAADTFNSWLTTSCNKLQQYYNKQGTKEDIESRLIKIRVGI